MKRVSRVLLIALIMFSLFLYKNQGKKAKKVEKRGFTNIKKIFPNVKKVELKGDKYGYNKVLDGDDNLLGYIIKTAPFSDEFRGYAGKVPVIIGFNKEKRIIKVDLLEHSESAGFIKFIRKTGFFEKWNGKTAKEALEAKVDTVSRATMTTSAVVKGINKRLGFMFKEKPKKVVKEEKNYLKDILAFLVLIFALISYFKPAKFAKMRVALLAVSVVILGFINGQFLSSVLFYSWLINGVAFKMYYFLIIVALIAIIVPMFTKKAFYCIYMCPYGAFQELVGKLTKKKIKLSPKTTEFLSSLRPKILTGLVVLLFLNVSFDLTYIEPFSAFLIRSASFSVIVLAVLFLVLSLFVTKPWCKYFCPTGQFLDSFHKINAKEKEMKFSDVLNILLAVLIAIILINPNGVKKMKAAVKPSVSSKNSIIQTIHNRKSVRNYTDKKVEKEKIQEMLKAGMAAPTAANKQPWKFVAIQDRKILNELADSLQWGKMLKKASVAIAVCGVPEKALPGIEAEFWIQDCAAASENILLAAEAQGLGGVWLGIYPMQERVKKVSKILGLEKGIIPLNVISIGYPKGVEKPKNKFNKDNIIWK